MEDDLKTNSYHLHTMCQEICLENKCVLLCLEIDSDNPNPVRKGKSEAQLTDPRLTICHRFAKV